MQNFTRRELICAGAMGCFLPTTAWAHKVKLPERFEPQLVNTRRGDWVKGDVHVVPDDFFLYFMLEDGMAIRYGVGVGRKGLYEPGEFTVARKAKWPWWRPTNAPETIGSAVSNGCARLTNEHVKDLYERVEIGARVFLYPKVTTA